MADLERLFIAVFRNGALLLIDASGVIEEHIDPRIFVVQLLPQLTDVVQLRKVGNIIIDAQLFSDCFRSLWAAANDYGLMPFFFQQLCCCLSYTGTPTGNNNGFLIHSYHPPVFDANLFGLQRHYTCRHRNNE